MPFALPPVLPPQQAQIIVTDRTAAPLVFKRGDLALYIYACHGIPTVTIRRIFGSVSSATLLVESLAVRAYRDISPAARVAYQYRAGRLTVTCQRMRVTQISGDRRLARFFRDLKDTSPTLDAFERDRVFAELLLNRTGEDGAMKLTPTSADTLRLSLSAHRRGPRGEFAVDADNVGNRFIGRNLVGASARVDSVWGTEFKLDYKHAVGHGSNSTGGSYNGGIASLGGVSPAGAWTADLRAFRFTQDTPAFGHLSGRYWEGGFTWDGLLAASVRQRSFWQLRAAYADRRTDQRSVAQPAFLERYVYAQPGITYAHVIGEPADRFNIDSNLLVTVGRLVSGRRFTNAASTFEVVEAFVGGTWHRDPLGEFGLSVRGQYAPSTLPEEQQFVLGGPGSLSAYLPGVLLGDRGAATRLYWSRPVWHGDVVKLKLRAYSELATAHFAHPQLAGQSPNARTTLADIGFGFTLDVSRHFSLTADSAWPLVNGSAFKRERAYLLAGVTLRY